MSKPIPKTIRKICEQCEQSFGVPDNQCGRGRQFCSRQCVGKHNAVIAHTKRPPPLLRECLLDDCSKVFEVRREIKKRDGSYKGRFCSVQCCRKYYPRTQTGYPIGTERLMSHMRWEEWYVKIIDEPNIGHWKRWKRKSVIVVERILGRTLNKNEKVHFCDGDRLNCSSDNVFVINGKSLIVKCTCCNKIRVECFAHFARRCKKAKVVERKCRECRRNPIARKVHCIYCGKISRRYNKCHRDFVCFRCGRNGIVSEVYAKKLTKESVGEILLLIQLGMEKAVVGFLFRVSSATITEIGHGKTWRGVDAMKTAKKKWEILLEKAEELLKGSLYDGVKLFKSVLNNDQFKLDMKKSGRNPEAFLNKKLLGCVGRNVTELLLILVKYPRRKQWESSSFDLAEKVMEIHSEISKSQKPVKKKSKKYHTATIAQVRNLEDEVKRLKAELKSANQIIKSLETQLESSRETIGSLNETISLFKLHKEKETVKA